MPAQLLMTLQRLVSSFLKNYPTTFAHSETEGWVDCFKHAITTFIVTAHLPGIVGVVSAK